MGAHDRTILSVIDAALLLGVTPRSVYDYARSGKLRMRPGPRRYRSTLSDVLALKEHRAGTSYLTTVSRLAALKLELLGAEGPPPATPNPDGR